MLVSFWGLDLGKDSLHLQLHCGVGLIGGRKCVSVLCDCGSALVFIDLEACHHLVHNGVGVVKAEFINLTSFLPEFPIDDVRSEERHQ